MSKSNNGTHKEQTKTHHQRGLYGLDTSWLIEFAGAVASWLLSDPAIAIIALAVKGCLHHYSGYLQSLSPQRRMHHLALRNTILGSGLLMAAPLMTDGSGPQWLTSYLVGALIAWTLLRVTGCMESLSIRREYYGI